MVANFELMSDAAEGVGCEVHEFPNSCAVQVLTEFGYTPEAFDATNQKVSKDKIAAFLKDRTAHAQSVPCHQPSLQLIVLNEDQIAAGIEKLVLEAGFTKQLETYAAHYRNDVALYTKCAWESREQYKQLLSDQAKAMRSGKFVDSFAVTVAAAGPTITTSGGNSF